MRKFVGEFQLMQPAVASGLVLLVPILLTQLLFTMGVSVGVFHVWMLPLTYLAVIWIWEIKRRCSDIKGSCLESGVFLVFFGVTLFISHTLVATDFDGLFMHVEFVRALMLGWNPTLDPVLADPTALHSQQHVEWLGAKLTDGGHYLKYGQILQGIIAVPFGLEASKAINCLFFYFLFRSAWYLLREWTGESARSCWFALLVSLNPVLIYQIPSFKHDGMVASLLSILLISGLVLLRKRTAASLVLYLVSAVLLVGVKKSGLAYASLVSALFFAFFCFEQIGFILRRWWIFAVGLFGFGAVGAVLAFSGFWDIRPDVMLPVERALHSRGSLVGVIKPDSVFDQYPVYREMDGWQQFLATSFSETHVAPMNPSWKVPGEVRVRELQNLYQAFTGYWIGGMGPLYGLALISSILATLLLLWRHPHHWRAVLYLITPILISVSILPSLSVRWVPQIWLICLLWCFVSEPQAQSGRQQLALFSLRSIGQAGNLLRGIAMSVATVNAILIVVLTFAGQYRIKTILDTQFAILEQLPVPLEISLDWFPSNRFWFEDRGLEFSILKDEEERNRYPLSHIYRTNTRIHFRPDQWRAKVQYPGTAERMSLEQALVRLESGFPSSAYSWHWIRPVLVTEEAVSD